MEDIDDFLFSCPTYKEHNQVDLSDNIQQECNLWRSNFDHLKISGKTVNTVNSSREFRFLNEDLKEETIIEDWTNNQKKYHIDSPTSKVVANPTIFFSKKVSLTIITCILIFKWSWVFSYKRR